MRVLIPIAVVAAAVALALALRINQAPAAGRGISPSDPASAPAAGPESPTSGPARVPAAEPRLESAADASAEPIEGPAGLEDRSRVSRADFSAAYAGWSEERLGQRLRELELSVQNDQDRLFKDRFERGLFETHDVDPQGQAEPDWDALAIQPPEGEVGRGRLRFLDAPTSGERRREYQFATLPRSEYGDFYRRLDERDWLRSRLSHHDQDGR
jgi:hypothetical protein